jgi:hypothetical protein
VLVWKLDRLVRRPKDFERLWGGGGASGSVHRFRDRAG